MQVKVFEARDMTSGLKMVKDALGPDALILSTRTIRNGRLGVLGKPTLEITAAIDSTWDDEQPRVEPRGRTATRKQTMQTQPAEREEITYKDIWAQDRRADTHTPSAGTPSEHSAAVNARRELLQTAAEQPPLREQTGATTPRGMESDPHRLSSEIEELRSIIDGLSRRITTMDAPRTAPPPVEPGYPATGAHRSEDPLTRLLLSKGINQRVAELVSRFTRDAATGNMHRGGDLHQVLGHGLAKLFTVHDPLGERLHEQKRICLIGPTGVGKTTTIAKLAAGYLNRFGGRVALVTIDTYRIAAVEQLKVYGEIMNLPVEVVIRPSDLDLALARHADCDLILIDTAGRSPGNTMELDEMVQFLRPELGLENHLLLSATSREEEMELVIRRFSRLPLSGIVFSKVDECSLLGVLLNIHYRHNLPISWLTNGQRVPEDILSPDPEAIARLIMNPNLLPIDA